MTETTGKYKKRTPKSDQKTFSLRLDDDLDRWVELKSKGMTKNRYINGLIRQSMETEMLQREAEAEGVPAGELVQSWRMWYYASKKQREEAAAKALEEERRKPRS